MRGCAAIASAICCAERQARSTLGNKVRIPRNNKKASKLPRIAPPPLRTLEIRSQNESLRAVVRLPAITSLCPLRYLVAECMTRSAPSAKGRVRTGVAVVLSTASTAPAAWAISAAPSMSVTDHSGLAGVSIQTSRVRPGITAPFRASSEAASTKSTSSPHDSAKFISQLRSPQYMTLGATT